MLGDCWQGVFDTLVMQHHGCYTSSKTLHKWKMACKEENIIFYIFYVIFCSFGPYFDDIGHYFVELVRKLSKWNLNVRMQAYKHMLNYKC